MKKRNIFALLTLGLTGTLLNAAEETKSKETSKETKPKESVDPAHGNMGYHLMTEDELLLELNDEGIKLYQTLDSEGKALAREIASQRCGGSNECRGMNACAGPNNACAGKGSCKGQTKCGFADKNLAVKVAAGKMAEKRAKLK